jgi:hypothetical protein
MQCHRTFLYSLKMVLLMISRTVVSRALHPMLASRFVVFGLAALLHAYLATTTRVFDVI